MIASWPEIERPVPWVEVPAPWSRTLPTEPGWYWHRHYSHGTHVVDTMRRVARVLESVDILVVVDGDNIAPLVSFAGYWQGPLRPD